MLYALAAFQVLTFAQLPVVAHRMLLCLQSTQVELTLSGWHRQWRTPMEL